MAEAEGQAAGGGTVAKGDLSLIDTIVQEGNMAVEASQSEYSKKLIGQFAVQILDEGMKASPDQGVVDMINQRIAQIDELMSKQMNAIMHAPEFQALESSWRGLHDMVMNTETSTRLKLRLLNVTKKELLRDLEKAVDHDMSSLFKKIYEEEYGTFGGYPYSCLIGDYYFGRHPQDITLLDKISHVAAAAVHFGRKPCPVRHEALYRSFRATRPVENLRKRGARWMAFLPRRRGFPLRGSDAAALCIAPAVWRQDRPG